MAGTEWDTAVNGAAIYPALTVIRRASEIASWIVVEGFMMPFTSTLTELAVLAVSALAWYALKSWGRGAAGRTGWRRERS